MQLLLPLFLQQYLNLYNHGVCTCKKAKCQDCSDFASWDEEKKVKWVNYLNEVTKAMVGKLLTYYKVDQISSIWSSVFMYLEATTNSSISCELFARAQQETFLQRLYKDLNDHQKEWILIYWCTIQPFDYFLEHGKISDPIFARRLEPNLTKLSYAVDTGDKKLFLEEKFEDNIYYDILLALLDDDNDRLDEIYHGKLVDPNKETSLFVALKSYFTAIDNEDAILRLKTEALLSLRNKSRRSRSRSRSVVYED